MYKKNELITIVMILISTLFVPNIAFSLEKAAQNIDAENFAAMISKVNAIVADFGNRLKGIKIGDISGVSVPEPLKSVTIDQYIKYGAKTTEGVVFYAEKGKLVPAKTAVSMEYTVKTKDASTITNLIKEKFNDFYKEIAPVLTDIANNLKEYPIRLESVSLEMAPLGVGGNITIGVNYDSPVFGKKK